MERDKQGFLAGCRPDRIIETTADLDPEQLRDQGIRLIMLDVDHTLVSMEETSISPEGVSFLSSLIGAGIIPVLVTNNFSFRIQALSRQKDLPELHMAAFKPFGFVFSRIARRHGLRPDSIAIVGDQLLSDILGGNRFGCYTILVRSKKGSLRPDQKIAQKLDSWILKRLEKESS